MTTQGLSQLPLEIWVKISYNLDKSDIFRLCLTNKYLYHIMTSNHVWWPKIKNSWYMSDYNPTSLLYKKKLKHNESYFQYFQRKKNDDFFLRTLINDILAYNPFDEASSNSKEMEIENKLNAIYQNFDAYVPCLLSESLHLTPSMFRHSNNTLGSEGYVLADDFIRLQKKRNQHLDRIYIASSILESGKFLKCIQYYKTLRYTNELPDDLETVLLQLSLLDSRYHELLLQRHSVIKNVLYNYCSFDFAENVRPAEKVLMLVTILHRVIDSKKRRIMKYDQHRNRITIEDLSILRFYCGDSDTIPIVKNAVVEKLCKLVGLNQFIEINEWCIRINDNEKYLYLFIDEKQMYLKNETQVPEILRKFPMDDPNLILFQQSQTGNDITDHLERKKYLYLSKFLSFYDGYKSRMDDLRGADQIIYQINNGHKVVTVHRNDFIQGQVLCCGGYVDKCASDVLQLVLTQTMYSSKQEIAETNDLLNFFSIFNKPILELLSFKSPLNFKSLFLKDITYNLKGVQLSQLETDKDIYWECEQLSIGDIVWSDASQARGIVVEISDSLDDVEFPPQQQQNINMNLYNVSTYNGKIKMLKGSPLYTIFFGAYGYATFSRQYLKKDKSDRVEGLLVYDLIGRWFSHYDYNMHKFIYRHGNILYK